jgi:hypothetical protein
MGLLFFLLNTSAKRIHWVIPRTDEPGRAVAPTPWVQRYLYRWETTASWDPIPRGPAEQVEYLLKLEPRNGSLLPPRYTAFLRTELKQRYGAENPCRNGQIPSSCTQAKKLSVTSLELLARCPYRFYVSEVAGWKGIRPLLFNIEPEVRDWGSLLHRFFERFFDPFLGGPRLLKELTLADNPACWPALASDLPVRLRLLPEPLQRAVVRRMAAVMRDYLESIRSGGCADARLLAQETKIRRIFPPREHLTISGQIDRVDDRQGQVHIVDYKSGQKPWSNRTEQELSLELGYQLQPLLYPWLYQEYKGLPSTPSFSFVFLGAEPPQEVLLPRPEGTNQLLLALVSLLEKGNYIPTSNELMTKWGIKSVNPCLFCDFGSLCRRFDSAATSRVGQLFETLARERFECLTRLSKTEGDHVAEIH